MKLKPGQNTKDVLAGGLLAILTYPLLNVFPFNTGLIIFAPLPVIAGCIRGKDQNEKTLVKALLMNIFFGPLIAAIMNGVFHLILIPVIGVLGAVLGIQLRRHFQVSKIKSTFYALLFFLSVITLCTLVLPVYFDHLLWTEKVVVAPKYQFLSPEGDTIHSTDHRDKVVVLEFWETWCGPCKKQFPIMDNIYKNYKGKEDVVFLFVNSGGRDTYEKALEFISKTAYDVPFAFDIQHASSQKLNITGLPTIVIIDKRGIIRFTHRGFDGSRDFQTQFHSRLDPLINK